MIKKLNNKCIVNMIHKKIFVNHMSEVYDIIRNKLTKELEEHGICSKDGIYYKKKSQLIIYNTNNVDNFEEILCDIFNKLTTVVYEYEYTDYEKVNIIRSKKVTKKDKMIFDITYILEFKDNEYLIKGE